MSIRRSSFSGIRQEMKGKMSHLANHCQGKSVVGCCDFLASRPGRYALMVDLGYRPSRSSKQFRTYTHTRLMYSTVNRSYWLTGLFDYVDNQYQVNRLGCYSARFNMQQIAMTSMKEHSIVYFRVTSGSTRVASQIPHLLSSILVSIRFCSISCHRRRTRRFT